MKKSNTLRCVILLAIHRDNYCIKQKNLLLTNFRYHSHCLSAPTAPEVTKMTSNPLEFSSCTYNNPSQFKIQSAHHLYLWEIVHQIWQNKFIQKWKRNASLTTNWITCSHSPPSLPSASLPSPLIATAVPTCQKSKQKEISKEMNSPLRRKLQLHINKKHKFDNLLYKKSWLTNIFYYCKDSLIRACIHHNACIKNKTKIKHQTSSN